MKFPLKRTIIVLLIIWWATWYYFYNKDLKEKQAIENEKKLEYTVKKWDIKNEVKVTWIAKLANEQKLSFWQEWKITNVYVRVWDEVKAWQILAELKMQDFENAINWAKLELENAKLWLKKLLNNDTSLREAQIKSQIQETKANLDVEVEQEKLLKIQLETNINQKNDTLVQLQKDYDLEEKI